MADTATRSRSLLAAVAVAAAATALTGCAAVHQQTHDRCTVTHKDRTAKVRDGNSHGSDMRVYTSCGTFQVADNVVSGWNSADLFGSLQQGHTYRLQTGGYRVGFLSSFPTITGATEVN